MQKKKAELEFQVHSMEEREKNLLERSRLMQERLEIQELEGNLKLKHESVERLETKLSELGRKMKAQDWKFENVEIAEKREDKAEYVFP